MSGSLLVRDVMTHAVKTVGVDSLVREAIEKMNRFNIGSVVVTDVGRRRPLGILTERDVLRLVERHPEPRILSVKDVMSHPVVTINADLTLEEAAKLMATRHIKRVPVLENERMVGIITSSDVVRASPMVIILLRDLLAS
jgi:CBS domain-containing protein